MAKAETLILSEIATAISLQLGFDSRSY